MKTRLATVHLVCLALLASGCVELTETLKNIVPSGSDSAQSLLGEWKSAGALSLPDPDSCTDVTWAVTEQTANSASGTFEARCDGGIVLSGTASGVLDGNLVFEAEGTATALDGGISCPFTLNGTGVLQSDGSIRVDYTAQTCIGPYSGTEIITR